MHLVPVAQQSLEVRRLRSLATELIAIGRQRGIFTRVQQVRNKFGEQLAAAFAEEEREQEAGLIVTRQGQRGAWFMLPRDSMGAMFDPEDLTPRIATTIETLLALPIELPHDFAVALALGPVTMLTLGNTATLGHRTSTSLPFSSRAPVALPPTNALSVRVITDHVSALAEEIVARYEAALKR
jgi:hypothetical protein